MDDILR